MKKRNADLAAQLRKVIVKSSIQAALVTIERAKDTVSKCEVSAAEKSAALSKLQRAYDLVKEIKVWKAMKSSVKR